MNHAMKNPGRATIAALCLALMATTQSYSQATVPLDASTADHALPTAGPGRPAAVPADYVVTPFGYFHPSCVMHLGNGDEVRKDETSVRHSDGTTDHIPPCGHAHYEANGDVAIGDQQGPKKPTVDGWVEAAATKTSTSFAYLNVYWTVPPAPSKNDGQFLFLFPAMEDTKDFPVVKGEN